MNNLSQRLREAYQDYPEKFAIHLLFSQKPEQALTYRQLVDRSSMFARALQESGIEQGEVVILILQHSQDLILSFLGSILRGAIPSIMPFLTEKLLPDHYRSALEALFTITKPAAVITYADFLPEVEQAASNSSIRKILISEAILSTSNQASWSNNLEIDFTGLGGLSCQEDEIVLLQHSSGTTGLQKGVALSHRAVFNQLTSYSSALDFTQEDVVVSWLPLYHDMGLIAGFLMPILLGATLVLLSPFDWVRAPHRLFRAITQYQGSFCWLPNFAYNFCAQKIRPRDLDEVDLSSLRAVINCSEPVHRESHRMFWERFRGYGLQLNALSTCYAMAENVFAVTQAGPRTQVMLDCIHRQVFTEQQIAQPVHNPQPQEMALQYPTLDETPEAMWMVSSGKPIAGTAVRILGSQGQPVPDRHIGEIAIRSDCMLTSYFHRPDITEKSFFGDWYLTGDLGYLAEGELFVTGRKKDLIIVGGKNIYPQDLERLANEVPGVYPGRVVAFGVFNETNGTEDVVIIAESELEEQEFNLLRESTDQSEKIAAEIRQKVTQGSDISLRFVSIVHRNWLIKTSSGKIARAANRQKYLAEKDSCPES